MNEFYMDIKNILKKIIQSIRKCQKMMNRIIIQKKTKKI